MGIILVHFVFSSWFSYLALFFLFFCVIVFNNIINCNILFCNNVNIDIIIYSVAIEQYYSINLIILSSDYVFLLQLAESLFSATGNHFIIKLRKPLNELLLTLSWWWWWSWWSYYPFTVSWIGLNFRISLPFSLQFIYIFK